MNPNQLKYGSVEHIRVRLDGDSSDLQLSKRDEVDLKWNEEARSYLLSGAKGVDPRRTSKPRRRGYPARNLRSQSDSCGLDRRKEK